MLTNYDLEDLTNHYQIPLLFCGMKDELPDKVIDGNYIINLQSSSQGTGTHWTALSVKGKNADYFDSYGAPPSIEIIDFLKKRQCRIAYNNWIIQDLNSSNCGYFCLAFLLFKNVAVGKTMNDFVNLFGEKENDKILCSLFRRIKDGKRPKQIVRLLRGG